ncbi:unnamed protein product [Nesidiocoris tenuis]|uniref:Uncharacterized protein n=1 Tax=Nesidiocoris tenuis TaxID=355587 RepID=A0A6H5GK07_9HEMI|nr:unnamed protein product [Nesidiocoris tenuis]
MVIPAKTLIYRFRKRQARDGALKIAQTNHGDRRQGNRIPNSNMRTAFSRVVSGHLTSRHEHFIRMDSHAEKRIGLYKRSVGRGGKVRRVIRACGHMRFFLRFRQFGPPQELCVFALVKGDLRRSLLRHFVVPQGQFVYPGLEIERQRLTAGLNKLNESLPKISSWQNIESNSMTSTDANGSSTRQSRKSEERKLSSPKKSTGFQSGTPKSGKRLVRTSTKGARSNRITQDTKATSGAAEMQEGETNLKKSKESKSSDTKKPHRKSKAKSISGRLPAKNEAKQSPKRDQRKSKSPTTEKPKKSSATKRSATEKGRRSMRKSRENKSPDKAEVGQKSKRGSRRKSDRKSTSRERSPKKKHKGPPQAIGC